MFLAIWAFVLQSALISGSDAKAAVGAMPEPSVTLSGSVHYHDQLAGHVHSHGGDTKAGHVHDGADIDDGPSLSWSMFSPSVASPQPPILAEPFDQLRRVKPPTVQTTDGVEPGTLTRPPSTLSIA